MATTTDEQLDLLKKRIAALEHANEINVLANRVFVLESAVLHILKDDPDTPITRKDHEGWVRRSSRKGRKSDSVRWGRRQSATTRAGACAVIKGKSRIKE
jgi:hypothetical protein